MCVFLFKEKIVGIVTDNGRNIIAAFNLPSFNRYNLSIANRSAQINSKSCASNEADDLDDPGDETDPFTEQEIACNEEKQANLLTDLDPDAHC